MDATPVAINPPQIPALVPAVVAEDAARVAVARICNKQSTDNDRAVYATAHT